MLNSFPPFLSSPRPTPTMDRGELGRTTASVSSYIDIIYHYIGFFSSNFIVNIRILNGATHRDGAVLSLPAPLCSTQQIQGLISLCMKRHCGQISLKFPAPDSACSASLDLKIDVNSAPLLVSLGDVGGREIHRTRRFEGR
jgi:hypothetical protein